MYYSAVREKNGIMKFVDKRMELEKVILSEEIQIQNDKNDIYSLMSVYQLLNKKIHTAVRRPKEAK